MKKIFNTIFMILGIIIFTVAIRLNGGDTAGFILITEGVIFIGIGCKRQTLPTFLNTCIHEKLETKDHLFH